MWTVVEDAMTDAAVEMLARLLTGHVRGLYSLLLRWGVATVVQ